MPGLEVVVEGDSAAARPALAAALEGQQLDDVGVRAAPATARELLAQVEARFLLFAGPPELALLAAARPSLLDQAVRALEANPEAAALVVPTDPATLDAQVRAQRLCPFPPDRPLAGTDLLFARVSACLDLLEEELPEQSAPRDPWLRALAAGRGLLLAQSFTDLFARRPPAEGLPPFAPQQPLPPPARGPLYRVWRIARGAAVTLVGEERVASALAPIKPSLKSLLSDLRLSAAGKAQPLRALSPGRRQSLALLEAQPVRHQRRSPLAKGSRARVVIATHLLTTGGVERALIDLCAGLDRERYELIVVTTLPSAHEWEWRLAPQVDEVVHLGGLAAPAQVPQALLELLAARQCDALLTVNSWQGYEACRLARAALPGLRTMDYQHTDSQALTGDFARASATRYRDALDLRAVSTDYLRERYRVYGLDPAPIRVIRSGCDEVRAFNPALVEKGKLRARLGLSETTPLVGFIGRMVPEKDPLFVLSVYAEVAVQAPEARFVFVGDGPLLEAARAEAALPALAGKVTFLPSQTAIAETLRDLSLVLMASRQEGLPLVFFEALALCTPVVATGVEGIPELIDAQVGACIPHAAGPDEQRRLLVDAAVAILRDPALGQRMGAAGRQRIERDFSSAASRQAWLETFALLVRR